MRRRARVAATAVCAVLGVVVGLVGCSPKADQSATRLRGTTLEVLGAWSGVEQQRFAAVLRRFTARAGVVVRYTSAGDAGVPAVLSRRLAEGRPPDLAMLPQPGLLRQLALRGVLVRPSSRVVAAVRRSYSPVWQRLGSVDDQMYGVWFKAAEKSLVWYDIATFERAGVVPPTDLHGLLTIVRTLRRSGVKAWAVSAREGWTLTDWFEDLYLHLEGSRNYDLLAAHRLPWTDPSVIQTLREMATILAPADIAGAVDGARRTGFEASVVASLGPRSRAAMVHEGDFVAGVITGRTSVRLGADADVFAFPGVRPSDSSVVGGGDVAVALKASNAADELLRFFASPESAVVWAARGGFVSPNLNLDLTVYPDDITRSIARNLLDAGDAFHFDLSDLQPMRFGGLDDSGMPRELRLFLVHRDAELTATRLEATAAAAYADEGLVKAPSDPAAADPNRGGTR
jgi:ABC-type glycerol-3-phosphate transport system substrate-binding protein